MNLTLTELEVTNGNEIEGSVMINMPFISEVEELGMNVRLHMASGNTYVVTGESFGAALASNEGNKYLKMQRPEQTEEAREVEGELVTE